MTTSSADWALLEGAPIAPRTGPFATPEFLRTLWEHRRAWHGEEAELLIASGDGAAALQIQHGQLSFLGHEDVVDYRSPVGTGAGAIAKMLCETGAGTPFRFDSVPVEAADALERALGDLGISTQRSPHTVSAVVHLPATFDEYLMAIGKKERHETRRKRRRFEQALGEPRIVTSGNDGDALDRFIAMHRMSPGEKGSFMTSAMAEFFAGLASDPGWRIDGLFGAGDEMVAAAIAWSDASGYYLYNSAFDTAAREASPGVVLVSLLVEQAIAEGLKVFDFLKGDEHYKFRLGAAPRELYALEGRS